MYHRRLGVSNPAGAAADLVGLIGDYLGASVSFTAAADWNALVELARRNRLAPLVHRLVERRTDISEDTRAILRNEATRSFVATSTQAQTLPEIAAGLADCPWVLLRGPVLGASLYGDVAMRPFIDLDVLVRRRDVDRAADALRRLGFSRQAGGLPDSYYRRYHLHLHLLRSTAAGTTSVELHWAVDHPFRLVHEDVPGIVARAVTVRVQDTPIPAPEPIDLLLTLAQHTAKHVIDLAHRVASSDVARTAERGELLHLVDIALALRQHGETLDWTTLVRRATDWGAASTVRNCLDAVAGLWPELPCVERREMLPPPRLGRLDRLLIRSLDALPETAFLPRRRMFFRPARLIESVRYVFPPTDAMRQRYGHDRLLRRLTHAVQAVTHLVAGSLALAYYTLVSRLRPGPGGS